MDTKRLDDLVAHPDFCRATPTSRLDVCPICGRPEAHELAQGYFRRSTQLIYFSVHKSCFNAAYDQQDKRDRGENFKLFDVETGTGGPVAN
jgi:hypothetical protein